MCVCGFLCEQRNLKFVSPRDAALASPPGSLMSGYSQCASTTSRGALSSGKLTARRVHEAVSSSSSSSSLSRSAALWPMAAHRRHFLFHTVGDVTWKHTKKHAFCYFTRSVFGLLRQGAAFKRVTEPKKNKTQLLLVLLSINTKPASLPSDRSVTALGISPPPLTTSAANGKVSQKMVGYLWVCSMQRKVALLEPGLQSACFTPSLPCLDRPRSGSLNTDQHTSPSLVRACVTA